MLLSLLAPSAEVSSLQLSSAQKRQLPGHPVPRCNAGSVQTLTGVATQWHK